MRRWMVVLAGLALSLGVYSVGFAGAPDDVPDPGTARATRQVTSGLSQSDMAAMHAAMGATSDEQMAAMHRTMMSMTPEQIARWCEAHLGAAAGGSKPAE